MYRYVRWCDVSIAKLLNQRPELSSSAIKLIGEYNQIIDEYICKYIVYQQILKYIDCLTEKC
jgi:hypothetical protein